MLLCAFARPGSATMRTSRAGSTVAASSRPLMRPTGPCRCSGAAWSDARSRQRRDAVPKARGALTPYSCRAHGGPCPWAPLKAYLKAELPGPRWSRRRRRRGCVLPVQVARAHVPDEQRLQLRQPAHRQAARGGARELGRCAGPTYGGSLWTHLAWRDGAPGCTRRVASSSTRGPATGRAALVFCNSRKTTGNAAAALAKQLGGALL